MCSLSEEEKVFRVLRELRERAESADVRDDVEKLEKLLNDPLFKQYSRKSTSSAPRIVKKDRSATNDSVLLKFLRDTVEEELRADLKDNQKLHFVEFDARELLLEVLDPRRDDRFVLIAGPRDVKARSGTQLRIGDRIAAVAWHANSSEEGGTPTKREGVATTTDSGEHLLILRSPTAVEFRSATSICAVAVVRETTSMVAQIHGRNS
ncbi:hypothetical protein Q1695_011555 [Nippostrongylus brasiliensis]|nr:hypothetical protein Q1695_011555 [Nippostrongylus brasiliensis]